jgi:hypothetical protein
MKGGSRTTHLKCIQPSRLALIQMTSFFPAGPGSHYQMILCDLPYCQQFPGCPEAGMGPQKMGKYIVKYARWRHACGTWWLEGTWPLSIAT